MLGQHKATLAQCFAFPGKKEHCKITLKVTKLYFHCHLFAFYVQHAQQHHLSGYIIIEEIFKPHLIPQRIH